MERAFLGVGWRFPVQVTPTGAIATSGQERKIEESIFLILSTARRERPMLPTYGCGIQDLVFAPDNPATLAEVSASVREALVLHEPRGPARAALTPWVVSGFDWSLTVRHRMSWI